MKIECFATIFRKSFFLYFINEPAGTPYINIKEDSKANNNGFFDDKYSNTAKIK